MSSVGECTVELLVFPIIFQTVSFHHRASYEIRFSFSLPVASLHSVRQFSAGEQQQLIDRNGNAWNVGGHAQTRKRFRTNKYLTNTQIPHRIQWPDRKVQDRMHSQTQLKTIVNSSNSCWTHEIGLGEGEV
jgi:hypothetical protein